MADTSDHSGTNVIEVCADGPLVLQCQADLAGETTSAGTALCRCGHSSNKPYCDGSHNAQGFSDAGAVEHKAADDDHAQAPLKIRLAPNGPISVCRIGNDQISRRRIDPHGNPGVSVQMRPVGEQTLL